MVFPSECRDLFIFSYSELQVYTDEVQNRRDIQYAIHFRISHYRGHLFLIIFLSHAMLSIQYNTDLNWN